MEELESEVKIGALTQGQVDEILTTQDERPGTLFGVIALEKGFVDDTALKKYLDAKSAKDTKKN